MRARETVQQMPSEEDEIDLFDLFELWEGMLQEKVNILISFLVVVGLLRGTSFRL